MSSIIAIKTERTQIDFLSDVLAPVASLDLKVSNNNSGSIDDLSLGWPPEATDTRLKRNS